MSSFTTWHTTGPNALYQPPFIDFICCFRNLFWLYMTANLARSYGGWCILPRIWLGTEPAYIMDNHLCYAFTHFIWYNITCWIILLQTFDCFSIFLLRLIFCSFMPVLRYLAIKDQQRMVYDKGINVFYLKKRDPCRLFIHYRVNCINVIVWH